MADNRYHRLMAETAARAPAGPVGRALARLHNLIVPERPAGMYSAAYQRQMLRDIGRMPLDEASRDMLRRHQVQVEAEQVRSGERLMSETSIPVRAGIEAVQERMENQERTRRRELLRTWMRRGRNGIERPVYRRNFWR
jgi:hypothetical protein